MVKLAWPQPRTQDAKGKRIGYHNNLCSVFLHGMSRCWGPHAQPGVPYCGQITDKAYHAIGKIYQQTSRDILRSPPQHLENVAP